MLLSGFGTTLQIFVLTLVGSIPLAVPLSLIHISAVISPVGEIDNKVYGADETVVFPAGHTECGPVMKKLRETLTGIQDGAVEDKHNWVFKVC